MKKVFPLFILIALGIILKYTLEDNEANYITTIDIIARCPKLFSSINTGRRPQAGHIATMTQMSVSGHQERRSGRWWQPLLAATPNPLNGQPESI